MDIFSVMTRWVFPSNFNENQIGVQVKQFLKISQLVLIATFLWGASENYWQQKVKYTISATLIDSIHTVKGTEQLTYINNSPDTLDYIYMHLWPNAYRGTSTMLAHQKFRTGSTRMFFAPDSDFGGIDLSNVKQNGDSLHWEFRSADTADVAVFHLNRALAPSDSAVFTMDFQVLVPAVMSRMGHVGNHYEMVQWYPKPAVYDRKGWHPMSYLDMGEFYSEWGDFRVAVTLPSNYRVAATGVLQDSSEITWRDSLANHGQSLLDSLKSFRKKDIRGLKSLNSFSPASSKQMKTIHFAQNNIHDFAWFADKRFIPCRDTLKLKSGRVMTAWTYSLPQHLENFRLSNDYIRDAVGYFSDWFMEYPYESATVVDGDFSAGGGMEYPMITLINNSSAQPILELTIIHEVGHNWFYGLSGSNERDYPYMDEGLNSYAENRYWAAKYPNNRMFDHQETTPLPFRMLNYLLRNPGKKDVSRLQYLMSAAQRMDQPANLASEAYTFPNYGMIVYNKTSLITETLTACLGDSLTTACWHEYFRRWAYRHPQPEDIRSVFEDVSGQDLSWFFDGLLAGDGRIDYKLDSYACREDKDRYNTDIRIRNLGDVAPPLPLQLRSENGSEEKTVWLQPEKKEENFQIQTNFLVKDVEIDPEHVLPETNAANNSSRSVPELNLYAWDVTPGEKYAISFLPYLWTNPVDRVVPGLIFFHHNPTPSDRNWYGRLSVGPESGIVNYVASTSASRFPAAGKSVSHLLRLKGNDFFTSLKAGHTFMNRSVMKPDNKTTNSVDLIFQDIRHIRKSFSGETFEFFNPLAWSEGRILSAAFSRKMEKKETLSNFSWTADARIGNWASQGTFERLSSTLYTRHRYSRKGSIRTTVFGALLFGKVPLQQNYYLASEIDPDFDRGYFMSRASDEMAPGQTLMLAAAHTLYGFNIEDTAPDAAGHSSAMLLAKSSVNIPKLEAFSIHGGVAAYYNTEPKKQLDIYSSISLAMAMGPVNVVYTPYRLCKNTLQADYTRVQIGLDFIQFGIRLGI